MKAVKEVVKSILPEPVKEVEIKVEEPMVMQEVKELLPVETEVVVEETKPKFKKFKKVLDSED